MLCILGDIPPVLLCVWFDSKFTFTNQVEDVCKGCFAQLRTVLLELSLTLVSSPVFLLFDYHCTGRQLINALFFKWLHLFTSFFTLGFPNILVHTFTPIGVVTIPGY